MRSGSTFPIKLLCLGAAVALCGCGSGNPPAAAAPVPTVITPHAEPEAEAADPKPEPELIEHELPESGSFQPNEMVLAVQVAKDGTLTVDGKVLRNDQELADYAKERAAQSPDIRVVIAADKAAQYGRIVNVMDLMRLAGLKRFAFAVQPKAAP